MKIVIFTEKDYFFFSIKHRNPSKTPTTTACKSLVFADVHSQGYWLHGPKTSDYMEANTKFPKPQYI